jgi:hypothetical protein
MGDSGQKKLNFLISRITLEYYTQNFIYLHMSINTIYHKSQLLHICLCFVLKFMILKLYSILAINEYIENYP